MRQITTFEQLLGSLNKELPFPVISISQESVEQFGKLTGDWNDHNSSATQQFKNPAVQGFFSLALLADFHKQICRIENTDPVNVQVLESKFLRPIFLEQEIIPVLTAELVEKYRRYIKTIWRYELRSPGAKKLVTARVEMRYYFVTLKT